VCLFLKANGLVSTLGTGMSMPTKGLESDHDPCLPPWFLLNAAAEIVLVPGGATGEFNEGVELAAIELSRMPSGECEADTERDW
jgi:hypothetical protein